jgi:hypothetical protein
MIRAACPGEKVYIHAPEMVQLAMKLINPRDTSHILDGVINATSGLRLRVEGENLISHHTPFDVIHLPDSIITPEDACNYIYLNHTPNFNQTLATVAANTKIVAMNSHHLCADGGFLRYIYEHCSEPTFAKRRIPILPRALTDIWSDQIRTSNMKTSSNKSDRLTRVDWRHLPQDDQKNEKAHFIQWSNPVSSLRVYNESTGKCDGLTERLWTALSLASHAYNGNVTDNFGILTCVDLRHLMKKKDLDIDICNNFIGVRIIADGITKNSTIKEIGSAMRRDFQEKGQTGELFEVEGNNVEHAGSCVVCLSNLGPLRVEEPFEDVWMQQTMESKFAVGSLCLLTWSKLSNGNNDFWGRLRYSPEIFTRKQATGIGKSIAHVLENMSENTRVDEAVEELMELQSKF